MQRDPNRMDKIDHIVCTQFFSWTPIIIGGLIALGLGFLLNLFGIGIGLSSYTNDVNGATVLAIGGFIGLLIGSFATMFTAGFAAGFFAAPTCAKRNFGVMYGFVAWCLGLLLMGLFTSSVGNYVNTSPVERNVANISQTTREVAATTQNVATRLHPATDSANTQGEKGARATGMVSLSMFFIFFIGAFAAALGGYIGFGYWDRWNEARDRD